MENDWQAEQRRDRELTAKRAFLKIRRRAASGEVHADLADGDNTLITCHLRDTGRGLGIPRRGAVRMHPDRRTHVLVPPRERESFRARREVLARSEDPVDAGLSRAIEDVRKVVSEASIGEVRVRVDHRR